jgi:hypothetical protein
MKANRVDHDEASSPEKSELKPIRGGFVKGWRT